jgi:hypothetical protein
MNKILFTLGCLMAGACLAAEPLGMVIDVQGDARVSGGGKTSRLEMLSYLEPQSEIQLGANTAVTVTWYAGAKELKFSGPAKLKVEQAGIKVVQGKAGQERAVAEEKIDATRKPPTRLGQAAIAMRGMKPMTPEQEALREKLRPGDNAPFGDWVVYAMGLEQIGLSGEAKGVWRKLAAQRPDDPKLRQLAQ